MLLFYVMETVHQNLSHETESFLLSSPTTLEFTVKQEKMVIKAVKALTRQMPRNYFAFVNENEKKDIRYVLDILANSSLPYIVYSNNSLKKAVARLYYLHPLQILITICNDQELISFLHKIRGRDLIWKDLFETYSKTLNRKRFE